MLQLKNIVKDYVVTKEITVNALKNISIDFRDNEFVSILGTSGCGKTTMLNLIGGLDHYTSGDLMIDGISTKHYKEEQWNSYRNNRIGFVFQSYNLIPHLTLAENVELALTISGLGKATRRKMAIDALAEVGLTDHVDKRPNQLSGGQMQRVAIARALVNNPQIVLADEPTGALDSKTSLQVMDLLKKVAKNHLVIMVTHNAELAHTYSTRIIELSDGEVIGDSDPFTAPQVAPPTNESKPKKVAMGFGTSLSLSFKNLLTKKGRTILTSVAGSIGIIGVALVLALSNGFNNYIAYLQSDTLSGFPLQVSQISYDIDAMRDTMQDAVMGNGEDNGEFPTDDNNIHVYDPTAAFDSAIHYNYITQDYIDYIDAYVTADSEKDSTERVLNGVQYSYSSTLNVFSNNNGKYQMVDNETQSSGMPMFSSSSSVFQEALGNESFVQSQYDVIYGKYPTSANQLAVVVDSYNRISIQTLNALGVSADSTITDGEVSYNDISFNDILNKSFYLMNHDDYYVKGNSLMGTSYSTISDSITDSDELSNKLSQLVADQSAVELEIVGVMRVKETAPLELYSAGILYLPSLTTQNILMNQNSEIWQAQLDAKEIDKVYAEYTLNNKTSYILMNIDDVLAGYQSMGMKINKDQAYTMLHAKTGTSTVPSSISFYITNFDGKDDLLSYLDSYNTGKDVSDQIIYTDATEIISSSMGQMIDIISAVLIAFSSISLVVSSVMIGIITYVSVIERTKEIGVLRSLGASKANVSQVFNAESILIGFIAGAIGVAFTYLISLPVNVILIAVAGGALNTNIAALNPLTALLLIAISCVLTLVASTIPARMAANLDPVKALRSE